MIQRMFIDWLEPEGFLRQEYSTLFHKRLALEHCCDVTQSKGRTAVSRWRHAGSRDISINMIVSSLEAFVKFSEKSGEGRSF